MARWRVNVDRNDLEPLGPQGPDEQPAKRPRLSEWWRLAMLTCAVIVAIAAVFIAYQEAQQTRYQRRQDCIARFYAGLGSDRAGQLVVDAQRRCYGLPTMATTTAPKHETATARR
jgi:hypothetical protein